ncbi:unnamed protein product [Trypanosoma congolense IL3000]|uniref:WGS project CAEQ00000000 data, annotated contig 2088 n=1 Tax=Trypanosoma congolense (strain IL3000) TaxID=1068625 RepID=F9WBB7_TRYCI|nr:unnamed protein product [Trypanosoma congolense IL3000]
MHVPGRRPVTRYNGGPFPSPRIRQGDSVRTFRRGTAILSRCRKRFRHSASGFCTKGGKVLPRYYYFGLECSSYYRSENGRRKRRRRLMMFTTDIHSDFITWLQFMSDMESKNPTVFLKKSKERKGGSRQSRGEKFNPDIAYFLNESDTNIGDESIESLSVVEPEDIEITIAPEETNEQEDVRLPVPFVPSLIHSTTSKQKSDSYRNLSDISDGEGERGAVRTASTFSLTIHSQAQQSQKEETKRSATPSPQPDDKTEEYAKKIKGLNRKKKRRLKVAHKTAYDELREKRLANENMELRHKNELYQIKVEKLTRQVRNLEQQLASVERVNHHLQDECDHLRKNMRKVETERATLALKLVQLNKKEFSLRREIDSIREINQELLRKIAIQTEHITVADARLRCAEGECETLGGLLGLAVPSRSDGGSATEVDDAREASLSLMDDAERIAENLRLASKAVRALETRLKESEERGRAAEEECERLREELRDVETDREALETNLQLSAALEGALRHQLQGALDEVRSAETALSAAECALYRLPEEVNCTLRASLGEAVVDEDESTNTVPGSSLPARIEHMARRACRQRDDLCRRLDSFLDAAARGVCDDEALSRLRALRSTRDAAEAEQRVALAEAEERLCVVTECVKQLGDVLGGSVVMEREAELLRALRADIEGACGVARSRVVDAALVDDGSQAVFRVVHSYRLPSAVMLARVDACAFDRVRRMCASSHADGAVMVEMAVEDEDEGLPQRGADEIVLVGTPAGEEMIARVTELSERYAAANDELCATEKDLMERSRTVVRELERRVAETRVEVEVLTEHITVADARLRCAEGECETLGGLLGLAVPSRSDGGSATEVDDAREASLSLMDDAERIAENLRLASKAVRALETRLKESEERGRAAEEECERLREELRDVETDREALETNLQLSAALEGALRHQLQGALDEVRSAETALSAAECALYRLPEEVNCTLRASLGEAVVR